ncbi:hypothetical protein [Bacillus toyonensis]|uniref:hypothetical protein n=1 Tax=Bacillus toyonensis TaxID=155322 RepID=UPI002E239724|nr:hypothetical protein [Bacillus toyonensis]
MSSDYIKELTDIYERYEEKRTIVKANQDEAKDLKNMMIEIMQEKGVDTAVVAGLDDDAVELTLQVVEREVIDKKMIAEKLGVPMRELSKLEQWVALTKEGKITPEMIEDAKFTEEREQFSAKPFKEEV